MPAHIEPMKRLMDNIKVMPNGCWEWQKHCFWDGYGVIRITQDGARKLMKAHRFAWELFNGPIPDGMDVLHDCDNPPCCSPFHLFLGDHLANMTDMKNKGRARSLPGESSPLAKLTWALVDDMRRIYQETKCTFVRLGETFNITAVMVGKIIREECWKPQFHP